MRSLIVIFPVLFFFLESCSHPREELFLSCRDDNDLYVVLQENNIPCTRYDSPSEAVGKAPSGSGVLILADGYPMETTLIDSALYSEAAAKGLRLYVEYPSYIPGIETSQPLGTQWERAVISSGAFTPELQKLRIVAIHDCRFIPIQIAEPDIVVARVAGFDSALYGLPDKVYPILARLPREKGTVLVSTTKLSQFVTGRYAPYDAWKAIWAYILMQLRGDKAPVEIRWTPTVRPSFMADEQLPADAESRALKRGIDWYFNSRMVMNEQMIAKYDLPANGPEPAKANPDLKSAWPFGHRVGYMPDLTLPPGDGSYGVMEGFDAKIFYDGTQPVRWWRRNDCNGEIAGAFAIAGVAMKDSSLVRSGEKVATWLFSRSLMTSGDRLYPRHPAFGLIGWNDVPEYCGPGTMNGYEVYYDDDNARTALGVILTASVLKTDAFDDRIVKNLRGMLNITNKSGFLPDRIDQQVLIKRGLKSYSDNKKVIYSPGMQAYVWAYYLWAYQQTGNNIFLEHARNGISIIMQSFPENDAWGTSSKARMLLPLSWLVRIENNDEHRGWLKTMMESLILEPNGAVREELRKGHFTRPRSNSEYATGESELMQTEADRVADLLYSANFAFLGLHEAAAATGDKSYSDAENRLAEFLCRAQIRSEKHKELDGGWFRALDLNRWEYWASNIDVGWGAWCIESGWTQSWINIVFALRKLDSSLWENIAGLNIKAEFDRVHNF